MTAPMTSREELPTDEVTLADFIYSVRGYGDAVAKAKLLWPMLSIAQGTDGYRAAWLEMIEHCNKLKEENFNLRAAAQAPLEDRCVEGRENLLLIAHEIREAKKAYLDGFGQVGNADRKEKLSQVLHDDATTIADALEAFAVSSTHEKPLPKMAQCPKCLWWSNMPRTHDESCQLKDTASPSTGLPAPAPHAEVREKMEWPSREIVAREVRLAMLDNPTEDSFNKRAEKREAIANQTADAILARFTAALPQQDRGGK